MAGLFDIASSGIQAYREALAITGQNIANIDTEGYRRRAVSLSEISASQNDITTIADQTGLGVQVAGVDRAFDSFITGRARDATSDFSQAEAYQGTLDVLEATLVPEDYDLGYFISGFFDGLNEITQAPGDMAARTVALTRGSALASGFSQLAGELDALRATIWEQAQLVTNETNTLLVSLQSTQSQLIASGSNTGAANSILDARDQIITDISALIGVSVDSQTSGAATVTLGSSGSGPLLGDASSIGSLAIREGDDRLIFLAGLAPGLVETQQVASGRLAGLADAYEAVVKTARTLDVLAANLATEFNAAHANGINLNGETGNAMFSADGFAIEPSPTNLGQFTANASYPAVITNTIGDMRFVYSADQAGWIGYDSAGTATNYGAKTLDLGEVSIAIAGTPADGDEFTLRAQIGSASQMRFLLTEPQDFAAAGLVRSEADLSNIGQGALEVSPTAPVADSGLTDLSTRLSNDLSVLSATTLRQNGVLGVLSVGAGDVTLASLGRQDTATFSVTDAQVRDAKELTLTLDGSTYSFDLTPYSKVVADSIGADATQLAELLNGGQIAETGGKTLADLGVFVAGAGGNLTFASNAAKISVAKLDALSGVVTSGVSDVSHIQVFTREGRQVAGTPLSQSEVVTYMTEANGFLPDAEYRADYMNGEAGAGYLGLGVTRTTTTGDSLAVISGAGSGPNIQTGTGAAPLSGSKGGTLTLVSGSETDSLDIPQGVSADYIATLINKASGDNGISAKASTRFALSGVADGTLAFDLTAKNMTPVRITSGVANGSLTSLRIAINARSADTGVNATISADGKRLVLVNDTGEDVILTNISSTGGGFTLTPLDATATARGDGVALAGTSGKSSVRVGGDITLRTSTAFSANWQSATVTATADAFANGFMSRTVDPAGNTQIIDFDLREGLDTNEAALDGSAAAAADTTFNLTLPGNDLRPDLSVSVASGALSDLSSRGVAQAIAAGLRSQGMTPTITGIAVTTLPTDGQSVQIELGAQSYVLTMRDGEVVVTGPEDGRLNAYFDANKQLFISAPGGVLSGEALHLSASTPAADAAAFGLGVTGATAGLAGQSFTPAGEAKDYTLTLEIDGTSVALTAQWNGSAFTLATPNDLPTGVNLAFAENSGSYRADITINAETGIETLRVLQSTGAAALGLISAETEITLSDAGLRLATTGGTPVTVTGSADSLVKERLTLTDLPDEELIVIMSGTGARRIVAGFAPPDGLPADPLSIECRVVDGATRRVEIYDSTTGHSLATRSVDTSGAFEALGYRFTLSGALETGDKFYVVPNQDGLGDARNAVAMMALSKRNAITGAGGFGTYFASMVTDVGAKVRAATISASGAEARRDAAVELEAEYSGVNLDDEAARLLEQQQAYQALARVLQTASDLLDTLINAIS